MLKPFAIDNIGIARKITLIVAMSAVMSLGVVGFSALRMRTMGAAYADLVEHLDASAALTARANQMAVTYLARAYQLVAETTDEGNQRLLADTAAARTNYAAMMAQAEHGTTVLAQEMTATTATMLRAFAACEPAVQWSATVTSVADNLHAAERLKGECVPVLSGALEEQNRLVGHMTTYAAERSDKLRRGADRTITQVLAVLGVGLVFIAGVALRVGRGGLSRPIGRLAMVLEALARQEFDVTVPGLARRDELGAIARAVDVLRTGAIQLARLRNDQEAMRAQAAAERRQWMMDVAARCDASAGRSVMQVTQQACELRKTASAMASLSRDASLRAEGVTAGSEQASRNVDMVAAASEQLAASVQEILHQTNLSTGMIGEAVQETRNAGEAIGGLAGSAQTIGAVVDLIRTIAGQTNLLALNATIEAARAGDAGKGFAVVASEVKALAHQTARATEDIGAQIAAIQSASAESVDAVRAIGERIGQIAETASAVAAAVEEQDAATREIARNVAEAARGAAKVREDIAQVSQASQSSERSCDQVLAAAAEMGHSGDVLKTQIEAFLAEVRAA